MRFPTQSDAISRREGGGDGGTGNALAGPNRVHDSGLGSAVAAPARTVTTTLVNTGAPAAATSSAHSGTDARGTEQLHGQLSVHLAHHDARLVHRLAVGTLVVVDRCGTATQAGWSGAKE